MNELTLNTMSINNSLCIACWRVYIDRGGHEDACTLIARPLRVLFLPFLSSEITRQIVL